MSTTHRRKVSGRNKAIGGIVAAAVVGGGAFLFSGTALAAGVGAAYTKTSDWSTGYTAQYVITNDTGQAKGTGRWSSTCRRVPDSARCGTERRR